MLVPRREDAVEMVGLRQEDVPEMVIRRQRMLQK